MRSLSGLLSPGSSRIVLAAHSATGHLYPLLSLAEALRNADHDVRFVTTADAVPWLEGLGYSAYGCGKTIGEALGDVQARFPDLTTQLPPQEAWRLDAELFADALPRANTEPLIAVLSRIEPDLVVFESANLAALLAAAHLQIPAVCLDLWAVGHWHVPEVELENRLRTVWAGQASASFPTDPLLGSAHLDPAPPALRSVRPDRGSRRIPMRRLAWGDPALSAPSHLRRGRPLVYLTLGTVGWGSAKLLGTALRGIRSLALDVVVAVGQQFDPAMLDVEPGAGDTDGSAVRIERFVRQDVVLKSVDLAVHHGGSGTLLGAAAEGVPQLAVPLGADQFQNAEALMRSGAGRSVPDRDVSTATIRDNIQALLDDSAYTDAARRLQEEISDLPTPAATIAALLGTAGTDDSHDQQR